jgi:hypothetical protein
MLVVETIAKIRRAFFRDGKPIKVRRKDRSTTLNDPLSELARLLDKQHQEPLDGPDIEGETEPEEKALLTSERLQRSLGISRGTPDPPPLPKRQPDETTLRPPEIRAKLAEVASPAPSITSDGV